MKTLFTIAGVSASLSVCAPTLAGDSVTLEPMKDNTIIQQPQGIPASNGAGTGLFSGRVGPAGQGTIRRGCVAWDVAGAVPAGATITSVTLTMRMTQTSSGPQTIELRRFLEDWGEGGSIGFGGQGALAQPGDVTWVHTFFDDQFWSVEGGVYSDTVSGSTVVNDIADYTWTSTPEMVADVQNWLDDPSTNYGWAIIGNESTLMTVKRFATREYTVEDQRPLLTIEFEEGGKDIPGDFDGDGDVDASDLAALLAAWGPCDDCPEDLNDDGAVGPGDLATLLANWG